MSRKVVIAVAGVVVAAAVAPACGLAWTSTSFGATVEPPAGISAVVSPSRTAALYPGGSVHVKAMLTNDTAQPLRLDPGTLEGSVSNLPRGCLRSWFRFAGAGRAVVVAGNDGTATVGGTLTFVDAPTDQSACAGATPKLSLRESS